MGNVQHNRLFSKFVFIHVWTDIYCSADLIAQSAECTSLPVRVANYNYMNFVVLVHVYSYSAKLLASYLTFVWDFVTFMNHEFLSSGQNMFCEVTVTFELWPPKCHPWMNVYTKWFWDITFTWVVWMWCPCHLFSPHFFLPLSDRTAWGKSLKKKAERGKEAEQRKCDNISKET